MREVIADLVHDLFGGRATDFRLRAGAEAFRHLDAHLHALFSVAEQQRLRIRVGDHEFDPGKAAADHVVDRIAARTANAEHRDPRLQFPDIRSLDRDCHGRLAP